ncbi:hypothetical protein SynA18461_00484 [Synechococcus sp. A18-46.1]|nr:hypothetical protein SynA18461_00484 [Synechococcus sp. A18-46.1]
MFYPVYSSNDFQCYPSFDFTRFFHRGIFPSLSPSTIYVYSFHYNNSLWETSLVHCASQSTSPFFSVKPCDLEYNSLIAISYAPLFERTYSNLDDLKNLFTTFKNPFFRSQFFISSADDKLSSFYAGEFPLFKSPSSLVSFFPTLTTNSDQYICVITPASNPRAKDKMFIFSNNLLLDELPIESNSINIFPVKSNYKNYHIVSPNICGVPLLLIQNKASLSIEHTHPLCEYFHGPDAFKHMRMLKSNQLQLVRN